MHLILCLPVPPCDIPKPCFVFGNYSELLFGVLPSVHCWHFLNTLLVLILQMIGRVGRIESDSLVCLIHSCSFWTLLFLQLVVVECLGPLELIDFSRFAVRSPLLVLLSYSVDESWVFLAPYSFRLWILVYVLLVQVPWVRISISSCCWSFPSSCRLLMLIVDRRLML